MSNGSLDESKSQYMKHFGLGSVASVIHTNPNSSDISTADTIQQMKGIANKESQDTRIRELASVIVKDAQSIHSALAMVWYWVKQHVRFLEDEAVVRIDQELLITPLRLLSMPIPQGDCDDFSTLTATLIIASGLPVEVEFVTIAADSETPERWSHVYVAVRSHEGYMVMDTSHGEFPNWEYQGKVWRKKHWGINFNGNKEEQIMIANAASGPMGQDGGMGAVDWGNIIESGFRTAYNVIDRRVGGNINPGEYTTGPGGTTYRLPASGGNVTTFPGTSFGGSAMWVVGAIGLGLVLMMSRR